MKKLSTKEYENQQHNKRQMTIKQAPVHTFCIAALRRWGSFAGAEPFAFIGTGLPSLICSMVGINLDT